MGPGPRMRENLLKELDILLTVLPAHEQEQAAAERLFLGMTTARNFARYVEAVSAHRSCRELIDFITRMLGENDSI